MKIERRRLFADMRHILQTVAMHPRALRMILLGTTLLLSLVAPALADKDLTGP